MHAVVARRMSIVDGAPILDDDSSKKKKFLVRLVMALHASGNLTFRTEKLASRVSEKIGIHATFSILPRRLFVSFQKELVFDATKSESYTFPMPNGWHINNLHILEQLCFELATTCTITFAQADARLVAIEKTPPLYSRFFLMAMYFTASFCSALLFYGGNGVDATFAGIFGLAIYCGELASASLTGLPEILAFASAFLVSITATMFDSNVFNGSICLYASMYGGVVWLLPGLSITTSLLEIYSGSITYGSSRLVYAVSQAAQLGFGLALGTMMVTDGDAIPTSFVKGCYSPVPDSLGFLLLPIAAASFSIMINSSASQLPGMILTPAVAQFTAYWLQQRGFSSGVVSFVCAILVTTAARLYAWAHGNERPLVYIISGLLVLVPGGVGVKGMFTTALKGDPSEGLSFVFSMITIGTILAIGVFVSLVPSFRWFDVSSASKRRSAKKNKKLDAAGLAEYAQTDVENLAPFRGEEGQGDEENGCGGDLSLSPPSESPVSLLSTKSVHNPLFSRLNKSNELNDGGSSVRTLSDLSIAESAL